MKRIFILLFCVLRVECTVLLPKSSGYDDTIIPTEIIGNFLHKYLNFRDVFLSIVLSSSNFDQQTLQQDLVSNLLMDTKLENFSFNILSTLDQSRQGNIDAFNLVLVDGSESLRWVWTRKWNVSISIFVHFFVQFSSPRQIFNTTTVQVYHLVQHYLVISSRIAPDISGSLHEIFESVMNLGLLDVDVLIKDSDTSNWFLYSYKPYVSSCDSFDLVRLDTFSSANYTNVLNVSAANLYGPRMFKFPYCWLYVSTFSFDPFVIIRKSSLGFTSYDGIDVKIVNEVSKTLKLFPIYMQPTDGKNRGKIFKNNSATGAIKMVDLSNKLPYLL